LTYRLASCCTGAHLVTSFRFGLHIVQVGTQFIASVSAIAAVTS
jgi:hypothetical protein